jgi:uncharacterized phosphosugar-binding protein
MLDRYADAARHVLGEVAATQGEALDEAARLVADCVAAGGLACVNPILAPALSPASGLELAGVERTEGRAAVILEGENLQPGEVVLVVSNSGVNAVPVEVALGCRERGLRVVALTNLEQAKATEPRHPSGARRHELANVVIDNRCPPVLASQNLDGRPAMRDNAELMRPYLNRVRALPGELP